MVQAWGGLPLDLGIVRDEPAALAAVAERAAGLDLLVTLGGASVGERDLVRSVLGEHGLDARLLADRDAPGQAADVRRACSGVPLLGLPGNPVSAGVCAVLFVRAAICVHARASIPAPPEVPAVLGAALSRPTTGARSTCAPACAWTHDGRLVAIAGGRARTARCSRPSPAPTA